MEDQAKYTAEAASVPYSDGSRLLGAHSEDRTRAPSLMVDWNERHAYVHTFREYQDGTTERLATHGVPLAAMDMLVAGWLQVRPLEVYGALLEAAERRVKEAGERDAAAYEAYQADRTKEKRLAWLDARHAEGGAIRAEMAARHALAAAREALEDAAKWERHMAEERGMAERGEPFPPAV